MRIFSLLISGFILAILCALIVFVFFIVEMEPHVVRPAMLTPEHIERAKKIIDAHRRQANSHFLSRVNILSKDVDVAANYLANHFGQGSVQTTFSKQQAQIQLSFPVPIDFISGYINLAATLVQTKDLPSLQSVRIGKLSLPDSITNFMLSNGIQWLRINPEYRKGLDAIKFVHISKHEVSVLYRWDGSLPNLKSGILALNERELEQLFSYHSLLVKNGHQNQSRAISLAALLKPLMKLAVERSVGGDAQAENRAVLLIATLHVLNVPINALVPEAEKWPRPMKQLVMLDKRGDFAKHFMVSAVITAYADTVLADAIGLYKEIEDARSGSGFSFDDIAADRAGVKFGEKAVVSEQHALQLQLLVATGLHDADLMPLWSDLPESMPESEFKHRFGGIDSPAYQQMMVEIERRVSNLPFAQ